jgi:hypothetical protein
MLTELFAACGSVAERFVNKDTFGDVAILNENTCMVNAVLVVTFFVVVLLLILFVGKFLWNHVACKYVTIIKPVPSVIELFALILLFDLVLPSCYCGLRS